jgi:hypothetical protein
VLAWIKLIVIVWLSLLLIGAGQHNPQALLAAAMVMVAEAMTFVPVTILLVIDEEQLITAMGAAPQPAS